MPCFPFGGIVQWKDARLSTAKPEFDSPCPRHFVSVAQMGQSARLPGEMPRVRLSPLTSSRFGGIAQRKEQASHKGKVGGSSPPAAIGWS